MPVALSIGTVLGAVKWFDGTSDWEPVAELYWNVVGTKWDVNIEHSSFRLTFPIVAGGKGLRAQVYTGVFGSSLSHALTKLEANSTSDRTNTIMTLDDRSLECERTTRLNPTEGLTVVLNLPAALVAKPGFWENFRTTVLPNIGYGLPIFASLGMLLLWFTYGRDPRGGPVVVQFEPPDGMSGSELGAMIDERVDNRDIAAAFVTLATKGLLTFEATEGTFFSRPETSLALTGKDPTGLLPFEMYVYAQLSAIGQVIDPTALRTEFATQISTVKELLYSRLVDRGYYNQSPNQSRVVWGCLGVLMIGFLGLITFGLTPMQLPTPTVVGAFLSLIPLIWFVMQMPRRTFQGARVRQQVLGFADFIRRAKGNQIEWAVKKKVDMATYEEYLPHAIALGLAHEWTDAFSSVLTSPPNWYHSPYNTFYPGAFANDLTSSTNSLASAATTMPRSSGSSGFGGGGGGGGFSGGGGGGGGGGSW